MLKEYMQIKKDLIEQGLSDLLPEGGGYGSVLFEAMRYSIFASGKRLRPCLFMATLETLGRQAENYLPFACALEMIHTYSLIHDDLPAMDDDDLRRGKPTCHKVFGEAQAILAGDALLTYAFNAMLKVRPYAETEKLLDAIDEVAWSAGIKGMVLGQVADILWEGQALDPAQMEFIHLNKTGALFRASIVSGAILGGAAPDKLAALTEYAYQLGLAFQIADDILDITGDPNRLGKSVGSDAKNQKTTYPSLYGMAKAQELGAEAVKKAKEALCPLGETGELLKLFPDYFISRSH